MTGRVKHAQRSKRSYKKKYIPVDMFNRNGFTRAVISDAEKPNGSGLFARLLGLLVKKKARESREQKRPD